MSQDHHSPLSVRDQWARYHVNQALIKTYNKFRPSPGSGPGRPLEGHDELPEPPRLDFPISPPTDTPPKICIIGAGAAGLFAALLFDYLNETVAGFKVQYDIFESGATVGGRLYTYNFSETAHDYYDVGAMRFPDNKIMQRTFCLFDFLGMQQVTEKIPPIGSIIPYSMQGVNEPWFFNGINQTGTYKSFATSATDNDPFQMNFDSSQPIPPVALQSAASVSPDVVLQYAIEPYIDALKLNPADGWKLLMTIDGMSTSQFLAVKPSIANPTAPIMPPFNYNTIEWLETFGGGTNWYDQAHSETVLEYMDFNYSDSTKWWCIEGGAQQLAIKMAAKLTNQSSISYGSRVTGVDASLPGKATIQLNGQWQGAYAGVFNSTTMGCMQQMDLSKAGLTYGQKQAIRALGYGASAKVGMKFSEPWWRTKFGINNGGLGHSDLPIRTTVYPSYNLYDSEQDSAVLLCSYEWQQDAQRISTLISSSSDHQTAVAEEQPLRELVLRDLALLHAYQPGTNWTPEEVYLYIQPLCKDHYAHDWYHDDNTYGAFAFFRPQQFGSMWPYIIAPSPSLVMIGEHASNHHAWVVGALESAVHGVHGWLKQNNFPGAQDAAEVMESWTEPTPQNPFGGLPPFVSMDQRKWQAAFGLLRYEKFRDNLAKGKQGAK
ncbi:hypothetical protein MMC11_001350 [Xylographa trunciseda]|nr:hypothetical protein [Xylographa trunciseda]